MSELRLFKYVHPDRIDILENERIAFTPPLRFNDPFDMHPTVARLRDRTVLRNLVRQSERGMDHSARPRGKAEKKKSRREKKQTMRGEPFAAYIQSIIRGLNKSGAVLCLSGVNDNLLMWAHYADSHRGLVLEFEPDSPEFRTLGAAFPIEYSAQRPVVDLTTKTKMHWFLTKGADWAYEKEYRIIRLLEECEPVQIGGKTIYFRSFPKKALKAVYLGVNMEPRFQQRVLTALAETSVAVFKGVLPRENFGLNFEKVNMRDQS